MSHNRRQFIVVLGCRTREEKSGEADGVWTLLIFSWDFRCFVFGFDDWVMKMQIAQFFIGDVFLAIILRSKLHKNFAQRTGGKINKLVKMQQKRF